MDSKKAPKPLMIKLESLSFTDIKWKRSNNQKLDDPYLLSNEYFPCE